MVDIDQVSPHPDADRQAADSRLAAIQTATVESCTWTPHVAQHITSGRHAEQCQQTAMMLGFAALPVWLISSALPPGPWQHASIDGPDLIHMPNRKSSTDSKPNLTRFARRRWCATSARRTWRRTRRRSRTRGSSWWWTTRGRSWRSGRAPSTSLSATWRTPSTAAPATRWGSAAHPIRFLVTSRPRGQRDGRHASVDVPAHQH